MMSASRAFSEVRRDAESKAGTDRTPLLEEVTIQVGGDEPFQAAKFISQRPGFKAREDSVTVRMQYETQTDDGTYSAEFTGSPSRFRDVIDQPARSAMIERPSSSASSLTSPNRLLTRVTTSSLPSIMTSMRATSTSGSKGVARFRRARR